MAIIEKFLDSKEIAVELYKFYQKYEDDIKEGILALQDIFGYGIKGFEKKEMLLEKIKVLIEKGDIVFDFDKDKLLEITSNMIDAIVSGFKIFNVFKKPELTDFDKISSMTVEDAKQEAKNKLDKIFGGESHEQR